MAEPVLGIDIGGSGIKLAKVDVERGVLLTERLRQPTPRPSTPAAVARVLQAMCARPEFDDAPIAGAGFPAAIKDGRAVTAANVDKSWLNADARGVLRVAAMRPLALLNDADAAGIAEVRFGAGKGVMGEVIMVTLGTGIGTGMFVDGRLVPNSELGHLEIRGKVAESRASAAARTRGKLSWKAWAALVEEYLQHLDALFWPDLFIVGGGVSAEPGKFLPLIKTRCKVVPAAMGNDAGIVGAAVFAHEQLMPTSKPPAD